MAKGKAADAPLPPRKMRPALTPEARENQLAALAVDLAERQLREGTASSQVMIMSNIVSVNFQPRDSLPSSRWSGGDLRSKYYRLP